MSHWITLRVLTLNQIELVKQKENLAEILPPHFQKKKNRGVRDSHTWDGDLRTFSIKSAYIKLNGGGICCLFAKIIWKVKVSLKIRGFL